MARLSATPPLRFPKQERLCSRRTFDYLFAHGSAMRLGVLSFFYTLDAPLPPGTPPLQIAFSAPKRRYKKAVSRNRLKRMMREAFRLQAPRLRTLLKHKDRNLVMLIIYQGRNIGPYSALEATMVQGIERLVQRIEA